MHMLNFAIHFIIEFQKYIYKQKKYKPFFADYIFLSRVKYFMRA